MPLIEKGSTMLNAERLLSYIYLLCSVLLKYLVSFLYFVKLTLNTLSMLLFMFGGFILVCYV